MPRKNFKIYLHDVLRIIVYIETDGGKIINFVVKLEYFYKNNWLEVERYDCFHGQVHKDILNFKKRKKRTIRYPLTDNKSGLNIAINDFKENYNFIVWRFLNEKK